MDQSEHAPADQNSKDAGGLQISLEDAKASVELAKFEHLTSLARVGFSLMLAGAATSMLFVFGLAVLKSVTKVQFGSYELFGISIVVLLGNLGFGYIVKNIVRRLATVLGH